MRGAAGMMLRRSSTALLRRDGGLRDALRSELEHELSSHAPDSPRLHRDGKVGSFTLHWDDPNTQDLVLKRRFVSGEEIAVSALLAPLSYDGDYPLPRQALMKVCVKKPESEPVLLFDCTVFREEDEMVSEFVIENLKYLGSTRSLSSSRYEGPRFSTLNSELQKTFKEYLVKRGIDVELTNFLLQHLNHREQGQYVAWLRKLENLFRKDV